MLGIKKGSAESAMQWSSSHPDYAQHIYLKGKNRVCIALKFTTQIQQKHSRSWAGSSWYGPAGLQEYDDKKGSIEEESAFWRNLTEMEDGLITEEREG